MAEDQQQPRDYIPRSHDIREDISLELPEFFYKRFESDTSVPLVKLPLSSYPDRGFLLKNVLTPEECEWLIKESERWGYGPLVGYRQDYRNNLRIVARSEAFSKLIFERIQSFVEKELFVSVENALELGSRPDCEGTWTFHGLNECWRFCRYDLSGHFGPHLDGNFIRDDHDRSFFTFMLYLNENFEGGETNFLKAETPLYKDPETGLFKAKEDFILEKLKPKLGQALVFLHPTMHEGAALKGDKKYILRSELMFKKPPSSISSSVQTEKEMEARKLFREAEDEESFDPNSAAQKYRRAFKLDPKLAEVYRS